MNRAELIKHIAKRYGARPEYLWQRTPNYAVFRHPENRKWFAAVLDVPANLLGLEGEEVLDIVDLKVPPDDALVLRLGNDILPGYHMNKKHWISVVLEGNVPDALLLDLLDLSFQLTA